MKKVYFLFWGVFCFLCLCLGSCQKEQRTFRILATAEPCGSKDNEKTYMDNNNQICWVVGDKVVVGGHGLNGSREIFDVIPTRNNPTNAELVCENTDYVMPEWGYAYYPADILSPDAVGLITLPSVQNSVDGRLTGFPMVAESTNMMAEGLKFRNICGAVKIHLQQSGVRVKKITLSANTNINGNFVCSADVDPVRLSEYTTSHEASEYSTTLVCETAQNISSGHDFFIYLPAGTYNTMQVCVVDANGRSCGKTGHNVVIERSKYSTIRVTNMEFEPQNQEGALPGLFSVSATRKVRFSKGNLQYSVVGTHEVATGGYAQGTWQFAANQYDLISEQDNANVTNGYIDRFCWATSGYHNPADVYNTMYLPNSTGTNHENSNMNSYGYGPSEGMGDLSLVGTSKYYDWGVYNAISNGGNRPEMWRVLTREEWNYLINSRFLAREKIGVATVNGVRGRVLLPDAWSLPDGCSFTNVRRSPGYQDYSANIYTAEQWQLMEDAGAVFFPLNEGYPFKAYWTPTRYNSQSAYKFYIDSDNILVSLTSEHYIQNWVRLCCDVD